MSSNAKPTDGNLPLTGDKFIDAFASDAIESQRQTGVPASVTLAQAILESGRGESGLSRDAKNFFGIKGEGPAGHVIMPTREVLGGKSVMVNAKFRKYNTAAESFADHGRFFLDNKRYRTAIEHKEDAHRFAVEIQRAGYATDPHYSEVLIKLINQFDLTRFDRIARDQQPTPGAGGTPATGSTPQPVGTGAPTKEEDLEAEDVLREGMEGAGVDELQDDLIALGYMTLEQKKTGPGVFGPKTRKAVEAFQRDNHLEVNGTCDALTLDAILQLRAGIARNHYIVEGMQERLVALGLMTSEQMSARPGFFDAVTESALIEFQFKHDIEESGILDVETYRLLHVAQNAGGGTGVTPTQPTQPTTPTEPTTPTQPTTPVTEPGTPPQPEPITEPVTVLRRDMRGPEVEKLQDDLIALGYLTLPQKVTGPGVFGQITEKAVEAFQRDNYLEMNGTYDAPMQDAIRQLKAGIQKNGNYHPVVKGAQDRLVALSLMTREQMATGPGFFGQKTEDALIEFQVRHGIEESGILDMKTYQMLHLQESTVSSTSIDVMLPSVGEGYKTYLDDGNDHFGRASTIRALQEIARQWKAKHPDIPLQIGDISLKGGGPFPPHKTHRDGMDVDVRPIRKDGNHNIGVTFKDAAYSHDLTKELVLLAKALNPGMLIMFNDTRLINARLTKPWPKHDNHLHFRFK